MYKIKKITVHRPKKCSYNKKEAFNIYMSGLIDGINEIVDPLTFSFHKNDIRQAYYIKQRIKIGKVIKKHEKRKDLVFTNKNDLKDLIQNCNFKLQNEVNKHSLEKLSNSFIVFSNCSVLDNE